MKEIAYVALGSNLDDPQQQILRAFAELDGIITTKVLATSSLYQNKAWGKTDQNDFINAVVKCQTLLSPEQLLAALLNIENRHGRVRHEKNGPRTLDCDLLLYGAHQFYSQSLTIPHPKMLSRGFVLIPLIEIAPDLVLKDKPIAHYLSFCDPWPITKIEEVNIL